MNITAINVFIEVDGKQCIALIDPEMSSIFMGMLPSFQNITDLDKGAKLSLLPQSVIEPLLETRRAIAAATGSDAK